ncbi:sulfurtransferase complex subunit TusD [Exilibacterium tricleocarpae]|uniref:Sulfurtransferase complex subunit TusD n=1 Tax=Exilibacterium tricleocarpae TaxID=2591008 RepID=A0A545T8A9_9GAMM|nr:sulfurtransferase complex subunit TusD [Exilibacterium tricleocarpae]TQV73460.1 sulfurtransferase complex subunit TusD [Exilibacterium tricleocarpae]
MIFSLAVYGAPYSSQASDSAYRFAAAALAGGHSIYRLFFYADGVHNATRLAAPPQDELDLPQRWRTLIQAHKIDSVVCIAAALRRGIINREEAERYERDADNLAPGFEISGLGQLVDAAVHSDRLVTFGD